MSEQPRDIDEIITRVRQAIPAAGVEQLKVKHPGVDDDGIWYFFIPGVEEDIQIESPHGMCPFIVETNEQCSYDARTATTVDEAVSMIVDYLNSKGILNARNDQ